MASKTDTEVIIGGKIFTLSGYESEEYLQKVAAYLNNKYNEYNKIDGFKRQPIDVQNILLQLNIADDLFKAKKQISLLEDELQRKEKELYDFVNHGKGIIMPMLSRLKTCNDVIKMGTNGKINLFEKAEYHNLSKMFED